MRRRRGSGGPRSVPPGDGTLGRLMPPPELAFAPPPEPVPFTPDPRASLPRSAEVVVVGGGMLGASAAYHLARAGMRPLVIEANAPAWGASGRNAGMALAGLGGHFPRVTRLVQETDRKSTRLNSSHLVISYAVFCLKNK